MSDSPIISVILPALNVGKYIKQCIESAEAQSLSNIEIICVDAGSTDGTLEIMNAAAEHDSRIRIIHSDQKSYGHQMNLGLNAAQGAYIGILETDDFIHRNMYEKLWGLSQDGTVDIVKGNFWDFRDYGEERSTIKNQEKIGLPEKEIFTARNNPLILKGHPSVWSAIYRKDFLISHHIRFMEIPGAGWVDNPFYFETICQAESIVWTEEPFYYYRKTNPDSSSNNLKDLTLPLRRMLDNMDVLEKYGNPDEETLAVVYERAMMYLNGITLSPDYAFQQEKIAPYRDKLLGRIDMKIALKYLSPEYKKLYLDNISPLWDRRKRKSKLLIYNWAQFDNPFIIGGGVTVYCYNLIEELVKTRPDIELYFVSSGWEYDMARIDCYIKAVDNVFGQRCHSFIIMNSPVPAGQDFLLNNPSLALKNENLKQIFDHFIDNFGPFDTIHFNNIEGISLDVLELKEKYKDTRFIYSMHNYVPLCATGFFFHKGQQCVCSAAHTADDCDECVFTAGKYSRDQTEILMKRIWQEQKEEKQDLLPEQEWLQKTGLDRLNTEPVAGEIYVLHQKEVETINHTMDSILAVSNRVRTLAIENGIDERLVRTSYIGTKVAQFQCGRSASQTGEFFKLAYLGADVVFVEKGYPFLLDALKNMQAEDAGRIDLILTARNADCTALKEQLGMFHSVTIYQGYRHSELKAILKNANLGVIPVLWEDCLPQIAIEMVAMGVPILCSDAGGASELCSDNRFRFKGGNAEDFLQHLLYFVNHPDQLQTYWDNYRPLVTMKEHVKEMTEVYGLTRKETISFTTDELGKILEENEYLKAYYQENCLDRPKYDDFSLKVGRKITWLPRKIMGGIDCMKQHGMRYTVKRFMVHVKNKLKK